MSTALTLLRPAGRQLRSLNAFSTSAITSSFHRSNRDRSKLRGVSAIRRQPKKIALAAAKFELPEPVLDMEKHKKVEIDPDHGLWGFFMDKKALPIPLEDSQHGRAWTVEELRAKSWDNLHKLWWVCAKELNIMETQRLERKRLDPGEGAFQAQKRRIQIKNTQRGIKHVLTERYYAWQKARELAVPDSEVDLSGKGQAYVPKPFENDAPEAAESVENVENVPSTPTKPTTL